MVKEKFHIGDPPVLHCFVGSKASWWEITDEHPVFAGWPPDYRSTDGEETL